MSYKIENSVIKSKSGIPHAPRYLSDGRLAFSYDEKGVSRLEYFAPKNNGGNRIIFQRGVFDSFRCFLEKDNLTYSPKYENTQMLPFAITADFKNEDTSFKYGVYAIEQSLVFSLKTPNVLPEGYKFKLAFYHTTQLIPAITGDYDTAPGGATREWNPWTLEQNKQCLTGGFVETNLNFAEKITDENFAINDNIKTEKEHYFNICIGSNSTFSHKQTVHNVRTTLTSEFLEPNKSYIFTITFDNEKGANIEHNKLLCANFELILANQFARYNKIRENAPILKCPYEGIENFFALAPFYYEALKTTDRKGAVRAKTSRYWVWGWDSLVAGMAMLYWGDKEFVKEMLRFFHETSDDTFGIAHAYNLDNIPAYFSSIPAQGMYICLLHHYYEMTNDHGEVSLHYAFVKFIFNMMKNEQIGNSGLFKGRSLSSDFANLIGETGNDISLFNNSICYSSIRAMNFLSTLMGDLETASMTSEIAKNTRQNYIPALFDPEKGMFVNSADATTLEKRSLINIGGAMWENEYTDELHREMYEKYIEFIEANAISKAGFRTIPVWHELYDLDANQHHCTWPVVDEFILRTANATNRPDIIKGWAKSVSYWTEKLLCPEGISYFLETDTPEIDNWNCQSGTWQAYSVRKWYQDILHSFLGIIMEYGGITFCPSGICNYTLENIKRFDCSVKVKTQGDGKYIEHIEVNGSKIYGSYKVPHTFFEKPQNISITVFLTKENPQPLYIKKCTAVRVINISSFEDGLSAELMSVGENFITFHSETPLTAFLNGKEMINHYNEKSKAATLEIAFEPNVLYKLEIKQKGEI